MAAPKKKTTEIEDKYVGYFAIGAGESDWTIWSGCQHATEKEAVDECSTAGTDEFVVYKLTRVGRYKTSVQKISD